MLGGSLPASHEAVRVSGGRVRQGVPPRTPAYLGRVHFLGAGQGGPPGRPPAALAAP